MESELLGTAGEVFGRREEVTKQREKDNAEAQRTLRSAEEEKSGEENPKRGTMYRKLVQIRISGKGGKTCYLWLGSDKNQL